MQQWLVSGLFFIECAKASSADAIRLVRDPERLVFAAEDSQEKKISSIASNSEVFTKKPTNTVCDRFTAAWSGVNFTRMAKLCVSSFDTSAEEDLSIGPPTHLAVSQFWFLHTVNEASWCGDDRDVRLEVLEEVGITTTVRAAGCLKHACGNMKVVCIAPVCTNEARVWRGDRLFPPAGHTKDATASPTASVATPMVEVGSHNSRATHL